MPRIPISERERRKEEEVLLSPFWLRKSGHTSFFSPPPLHTICTTVVVRGSSIYHTLFAASLHPCRERVQQTKVTTKDARRPKHTYVFPNCIFLLNNQRGLCLFVVGLFVCDVNNCSASHSPFFASKLRLSSFSLSLASLMIRM